MTAAKSKSPAKPASKDKIKLAFAVNRVATEQDNYTTIRLARKASGRGHDVALIGLGDFICDADNRICAMASVAKVGRYKNDTSYLAHLQDKGHEKTRIALADYDILMLRSDPAVEMGQRDWAPSSGLLFAQLAADQGTIVLNDPRHLTNAVNKTYFQGFPEAVRPATCITREADEIGEFVGNLFRPAMIERLDNENGTVTIKVADKDKGLAIGRGGKRVNRARMLLKRLFDSELRVV